MNRLSLRNNQFKLRLQKCCGSLHRNLENIPQINGGKKLKDVNLYPVGLGNSRISTNYAQNFCDKTDTKCEEKSLGNPTIHHMLSGFHTVEV
jgi:hypothetical protein